MDLYFYPCEGGGLKVAVTADNNGRSVRLINELTQNLKVAIPFKYDVLGNGDPKIHIQGNDNLAVAMIICPRGLDTEEAVGELLGKKFEKKAI